MGKKADIVIFDTKRPEWRPMYNEIQNLVHSATGDSMERLIIDGRIVIDRGKFLTADDEKVLAKMNQREMDLKSRLDMHRAYLCPQF